MLGYQVTCKHEMDINNCAPLLSAQTFFAASHATDGSCGPNGLPLTPNSLNIRARVLAILASPSMRHPHLARYVDCIRDQHGAQTFLELV